MLELFSYMLVKYLKKLPKSLSIALFFFFAIAVFTNFIVYYNQQYSYSAMSILNGHFYLSKDIPRIEYFTDSVEKNGERYFTLGPGPILLLLVPSLGAKIVNIDYFPQGYLQIVLLLAIFLLTYRIAKKKDFSTVDATYLSIAFVFASPLNFVGTIPWSWYFAHIVAIFFSLLGIYEFQNKRRFALIGLYIGMAFMSRFTAGFIAVLYVLLILFNSKKDENIKTKILNLTKLSIPILSSLVLLLIYNKVRFGNAFNNGYSSLANEMYYKNFKLETGNTLFSLKYIPRNIYYYFLKPTLSFPSTGFFFLYPFYLYIFSLKPKTREVKIIILSTLFILLALLAYYWPGWVQIGPRYLLDLFPLLYLGILEVFKDKKLTSFTKTVVMINALVNTFLTINMLFI